MHARRSTCAAIRASPSTVARSTRPSGRATRSSAAARRRSPIPTAGRAIFRSQGSDPPSSEAHLFRADIHEAVLVGLNEARDRLVIDLWRPGQELKRIERE